MCMSKDIETEIARHVTDVHGADRVPTEHDIHRLGHLCGQLAGRQAASEQELSDPTPMHGDWEALDEMYDGDPYRYGDSHGDFVHDVFVDGYESGVDVERDSQSRMHDAHQKDSDTGAGAKEMLATLILATRYWQRRVQRILDREGSALSVDARDALKKFSDE